MPLHYYDRRSKQELDFIIEDNYRISVLEVKSGDSFTQHASLDAAMSLHKDEINRGIVLCKSNIQVIDNVIYLPLYMTMFV